MNVKFLKHCEGSWPSYYCLDLVYSGETFRLREVQKQNRLTHKELVWLRGCGDSLIGLRSVVVRILRPEIRIGPGMRTTQWVKPAPEI